MSWPRGRGACHTAELARLLRGVKNFNVAVREVQSADQPEGGIVFLHKIVEGGASQSYGIHVARLAGIPKAVLERSRDVLEELQRGFERESRTPQLAAGKTRLDAQMTLFTHPGDEWPAELRGLDLDRMTPLEALQRLQQWKDRAT